MIQAPNLGLIFKKRFYSIKSIKIRIAKGISNIKKNNKKIKKKQIKIFFIYN